MSELMRVILLYGGKSGEHEISLLSAASVLKQLNTDKYQIIPIGMDKKGCFFVNSYEELLTYTSLPVQTALSKPLASLFANGELTVPADVIFPMVHGPLYEDGSIQGLFKLANAAFVGCDVLASAMGMDKDIARRLVGIDGIPYANYRTLSWHSTESERQAFCDNTVQDLGWPLFIKPCSLGSSVGIHKATSMAELVHAINDALRYDETIIVEQFIKGREIELAVLENINPVEPPLVSVAGEIKPRHPDGFYSYAAKYIDCDSTEFIAPAPLTSEIEARLKTMAATIFTNLKCKGLARVDFFVNDETNRIYFNEINTLPGFTAISMYPKLWQLSGINYSELLDRLIHSALRHSACRKQIVTDYQ